TTPPVISGVPANISTTASGPTTPVTYTAPTATDNVDGTDPVTCSPASGSGFSVGTTTVTCNAHDVAGNQATPASFTVTVMDNLPPVIPNVPSNVNASATGPSTPVSFSLPSATDNVDGNVPVSCTPAPGSGFPIGPTTVDCSATDSSHNTA